MGGLAGCGGGGGHLSLVVLVSEKPNSVSEKSGKSQGILFICGAGNPGRPPRSTPWTGSLSTTARRLVCFSRRPPRSTPGTRSLSTTARRLVCSSRRPPRATPGTRSLSTTARMLVHNGCNVVTYAGQCLGQAPCQQRREGWFITGVMW